MSGEAPLLIYWDTNAVLDLCKKTNEYKELELLWDLSKPPDSRFKIVMSPIVITEAFHLGPDATDEDLAHLDFLFTEDWVDIKSLTRPLALHCQKVRRAPNNLRHFDAIHVGTATYFDIPYLITRDGDGSKNKNPILMLHDKLPLRKNGGKRLQIVTPRQFTIDQGLDVMGKTSSD